MRAGSVFEGPELPVFLATSDGSLSLRMDRTVTISGFCPDFGTLRVDIMKHKGWKMMQIGQLSRRHRAL